MAGEPSKLRATPESLRDLLYRLQVIADWNDEFKEWQPNVDPSVVDETTATAVYWETWRLIDESCDQLCILAESLGIDCTPLTRFCRDHNPTDIPKVEDLLSRLHVLDWIDSGKNVPRPRQPPLLTEPPPARDQQGSDATTDWGQKRWWKDTEPPDGSIFKYGTLEGSMTEFSKWTTLHRQTLQKHNGKSFCWIQKLSGKLFQIWFSSKKVYTEANHRRLASRSDRPPSDTK